MLTSLVSPAAFPQSTHVHHLTAFSNQKKKKQKNPEGRNQSNLQESFFLIKRKTTEK